MTADLNPARLIHFPDWAKTLPLPTLPRTVTPVAGEYHLDYVARLAAVNHLVVRTACCGPIRTA